LVNQIGNYDVVNLHGPAPTMCDAFLALHRLTQANRRPALVYSHHFDVDFEGANWACQVYGRLFNRLLRASDHVITTTNTYANMLSYRVRCPITAAPLGVDPQRCSAVRRVTPASPTPLRVLFLGQFRRYKGLDTLLSAVRATPHVSVSIGGRGPLAAYVNRRVLHERLTNVSVIPYVEDGELAALYARHDVVVLPSRNRQEAFGLVLLEGMAAGLVPVASALPGVAEVARMTGLTFPPGDADALSAVLNRLDSNRDDLRRRSERGPVFARRFTWASMACTYERVLVETVHARTPGHGASNRNTASTSPVRSVASWQSGQVQDLEETRG
jgi:rhamnosyl/mannosyltransferase